MNSRRLGADMGSPTPCSRLHPQPSTEEPPAPCAHLNCSESRRPALQLCPARPAQHMQAAVRIDPARKNIQSTKQAARLGGLSVCTPREPRFSQCSSRCFFPAPAVLAETAPPDRSQTAVPISVELAKKRHALTLKAHPTKPAGSKKWGLCTGAAGLFPRLHCQGGDMPE